MMRTCAIIWTRYTQGYHKLVTANASRIRWTGKYPNPCQVPAQEGFSKVLVHLSQRTGLRPPYQLEV